jgi:hypothetical protein
MRKIYKYLSIVLFVVGLLYLTTMICKAGVEEGFSLPGVKLPGVVLPDIRIPGVSKIRPYMREARILKEEGMRQIDKFATRYATQGMKE